MTKKFTAEQVFEKLFIEAKPQALNIIYGSIWDTVKIEEHIEDIFTDSLIRLYDVYMDKDKTYDYVDQRKRLFGIIKKQVILYNREMMDRIHINDLTPRGKGLFSGSSWESFVEDDVISSARSNVLLPLPSQLYDRERDKDPERKRKRNLNWAKRWEKIKSDPEKHREYLDKKRIEAKKRKELKENGTYKDRRFRFKY